MFYRAPPSQLIDFARPFFRLGTGFLSLHSDPSAKPLLRTAGNRLCQGEGYSSSESESEFSSLKPIPKPRHNWRKISREPESSWLSQWDTEDTTKPSGTGETVSSEDEDSSSSSQSTSCEDLDTTIESVLSTAPISTKVHHRKPKMVCQATNTDEDTDILSLSKVMSLEEVKTWAYEEGTLGQANNEISVEVEEADHYIVVDETLGDASFEDSNFLNSSRGADETQTSRTLSPQEITIPQKATSLPWLHQVEIEL